MKLFKIRREVLVKTFYSDFIYRLFPPFLGTLLIILPAVLYGCEKAAGQNCREPVFRLTKVSLPENETDIATLDIFVFRDDRFRKLDCYQRFDSMDDWKGAVVSGSGKRIISVLANSPYERDGWAAINSHSYLGQVSVMLEDETRENPQMYGETAVSTDSDNQEVNSLQFSPFVAEIVLNSLNCDFTGKAYEGEKLSDIKVYLTNVNAECRILEPEDSAPRHIINAGRLKEEEVSGFKDPSILMQTIPGEAGKERIHPNVSLRCYRSNHLKESPGAPYTRLVIEGKVSGQTYYWPVNINRDTDQEAGIWGNRRYIYDIGITCKGTTNPDMPVKSGDITINQRIAKWEEKEEYKVSF